MSLLHWSIAAAWLSCIVVGVAVFFANAKRTVNQHFLSLSLTMALWLTCILIGSLATDRTTLMIWIRNTSAVGPFMLTGFNWLRLAIVYKDDTWFDIVRRGKWWILLNAALIPLCYGNLFLRGAILSADLETLGRPIYGPWFSIYAVYWIIGFPYLLFRFAKDAHRLSGVQRTEIQFILLGYAVVIFIGVLLVVILPLAGNLVAPQFAPVGVTFLYCIIAYGVATHRIMGVADLLRHAMAFLLLIAYLVGLYLAIWWVIGIVTSMLSITFPLANLVATLAVAFSLAPANGFMQRFAIRLFGNMFALNVPRMLQDAHRVLRSIDTVDAILGNFAGLVTKAVSTDRLFILLSSNGQYIQRYPASADADGLTLAISAPIVAALASESKPLVADVIRRMRPTDRLVQARVQMLKHQIAAAVAIRSRGQIEGVMLFGSRLSGRIYGTPEQDALQILSDQLAVALENAQLYTQVQNSKLYNDILLDQLISGVIAANAEKKITVFNKEAQRVTGLQVANVIGHSIDMLPPLLAGPMHRAYLEGEGVRDAELTLRSDSTPETPIRLSTAPFGKDNGILGVLLVFSDLSTLKKLEMQVRRSDRLASLGTLSAGMAHEIKNPLVTLKTFTQLLPERYDDSDFRNTFSSLIGQEVKRIDTIVNQLLSFAAPIRPLLAPTHVHELTINTLRLLQEQLRQKRIVLDRALNAPTDLIEGDANLLGQVFVNILLNAIDSMGPNGKLSVTTSVIPYRMTQADSKSSVRDCICVSVSDTGDGIRNEDLPRIFDPFFTTKSNGTGLGLSVAHGIVGEHGGVIDVESEPGKGTTFHIILPLQTKEMAA